MWGLRIDWCVLHASLLHRSKGVSRYNLVQGKGESGRNLGQAWDLEVDLTSLHDLHLPFGVALSLFSSSSHDKPGFH